MLIIPLVTISGVAHTFEVLRPGGFCQLCKELSYSIITNGSIGPVQANRKCYVIFRRIT